MIGAIGNGNLRFRIVNPLNCSFEMSNNSGVSIWEFTQLQLLQGTIQIVSNAALNSPSFIIQIIDSYNRPSNYSAQIIYYFFPKVSFTIKQSMSIILNGSYINSIDPLIDYIYTVSNLVGGLFKVNGLISNIFTQAQINGSNVAFYCTDAVSYNLVVSDGNDYSSVSVSQVSFIPLPYLSKNYIYVKQGSSIVLNASQINLAGGPSGYDNRATILQSTRISFWVNSLRVSAFTQSQILSGSVTVVHDGSAYAPICVLNVTDGQNWSSISVNVTFSILPVLLPPQIFVKFAKFCILAPYMINAFGDPSLTLTFVVLNVTHGFFSKINNKSTSVLNFTQDEIKNGTIMFTHDGKNFTPTFSVYVNDGSYQTNTLLVTIILIPLPQIITNIVTIKQGSVLFVRPNNIDGTVGTSLFMTFYVQDFKYCTFSRVSAPGVAISNFTKTDILRNQIVFIHDGSSSAPSYTLIVGDGVDNVSSIPTVTFIALPVLTNKQFTIHQGESLNLNDSMVKAVNPSTGVTLNGDIIFFVSGIKNGYFGIQKQNWLLLNSHKPISSNK